MKTSLLLAAVTCAVWGQYDPPTNVRVFTYTEEKSGTASPGGLVRITGESVAKSAAYADGGFADSLAGTRVEVQQNGRKFTAPLARVSVRDAVAQMPFELVPGTADVVVVTALGSRSTRIQVVPATPSPITYEGLPGGIVRARHDDGRLVVDSEAPAQPGERLRLAAAGLGVVEPAGNTGKPGGDGTDKSPLQTVKSPVAVLVGEQEVPAEEAILSPDAAGEYSVAFRIPEGLPPAWYPVKVKAGDAVSTAFNRIYVGPPKNQLAPGYLAGPCGEVASFRFRLAARAWVRAIGIRAKFSGSGSYRLLRGEEELATGVVWPRTWETVQPEWRWGGFQWTEKALEAGEYLVELSNVQACASPEQEGLAGVKVEGGWMESLWSEAGGGWLTPDGGSVEAAGLALTAEPGAIPEPLELRVSRYEEQTGGEAIPYYRIDGLPQYWAAPLRVALTVEGAVLEDGEDAALAWKTTEENGLAPRLLRGRIENGRLLVELPPNPAPAGEPKTEEKTASAGSPMAARPKGIGAMLWAVMGLRWTSSPKDHFIVYYPRGEETLAESLGETLEQAYDMIAGMGLDWSRRQNWPLEVYVFSYNSWSSYVLGGSGDNEGNTESDLWGAENVGLCLNLDTIRYGRKLYLEDANLTAGHELLHIMQTLYDPRGRLRKTFIHSTWLWLMEASATWFEKAMASKDSYVPLNAIEKNWAFPFQRALEAPPGILDGTAARRHGYGASAFLQHIAPASTGNAPALVGEILKLLGAVSPVGEDLLPVPEYSPVRAIREVLGGTQALMEQWHQFADRYVQGEVWGGFPKTGDLLRSPAPPTAVTFSKDLTQYKTTLSIPELSAAHLILHFPQNSAPALKDSSRLRLQITDAARGTRAFLYAVTEAGLLRMGEFTGIFEVENAKSLFESGQPLYLLLANGRNTFDGRTKSEVELKLEVGEPFEGVQSASVKSENSCYNNSFTIELSAEVRSSAAFRVLLNARPFPCMNTLRVENTPWNPDDPELVDTYTIQFSFANLTLRHGSGVFEDYRLEPQFSTDGGKTWVVGNRGTTSFTFHRGSRSYSHGVVVRPVFYKAGKEPFVINSGDAILTLEVNGLK